MKLRIDSKFIELCNEIILHNKNEAEWALIESSDMFQNKSYCGGFDADENRFCFSYYDSENREFWFQISLSEIHRVMNNVKTDLEIRKPD